MLWAAQGGQGSCHSFAEERWVWVSIAYCFLVHVLDVE